MTRTFRIEPGAYEQFRKRFFRRSVPFLVFIAALVTLLNYHKWNGELLFDIGIPVLFFGLVTALAVTRALNRQRTLFRSFTLEVSELEVTRRSDNTTPLTLHAYDISSIEEDKSGAFVIRGRAPREVIIVPAQVEAREELRALLDTLQPVTIGVVATPFEKGRALRGILRLVSVLVVFSVQNNTVVGVAVPVALLLLGWDMYDLQRSGQPAARRVPRLLLNGFLMVLVLFTAWSRWYLKA